jgi:hypothetical protein
MRTYGMNIAYAPRWEWQGINITPRAGALVYHQSVHFKGDWYDSAYLTKLLATNKNILVVSSELHGRPTDAQWALLDSFRHSDKLTLCTDLPEAALERFCA